MSLLPETTSDTDITQALPVYADDALAALSTAELIQAMIRDEDRVPRNVIETCVRRSEEMVDALRKILLDDRNSKIEASRGEWHLLPHAIMILGQMPEESAGLLLVQSMRHAAQHNDYNLLDCLAESQPVLFRNKPPGVIAELRALSTDRDIDWYARAYAVDSVLVHAEHESSSACDAAVDWAAAMIADESEDWDFRVSVGHTLLDFAPERHRPLLEDLAQRQEDTLDGHFDSSDVDRAYSASEPNIFRIGSRDPWGFYTPAAIAHRQQIPEQEDQEDDESEQEEDFDDDYEPITLTLQMPYVRPEPKIGRNDPCPCGSGKKYKKCCLNSNPD